MISDPDFPVEVPDGVTASFEFPTELERLVDRCGRGVASTQEGERLRVEVERLAAVADAAQRKHEKTGFCPFCEAGPPPHHNEGCALLPGRSEGSGGRQP